MQKPAGAISASKQVLTNLENRKLAELAERCSVRRLDLFGSAATGRFDPDRSDLDFLVDFEPLPPAAYGDAFFRLREGLESLFGRDIDLVTDVSLKNPWFRERVNSERHTIFARG
ncbi:MAG: nucleotidyltransferase family protein [Rhizomicrobium sp.]